MNRQTLIATTIGVRARELLGSEGAASVLGWSAGGLFLRLSHGWVIYLSMEKQRGPLTLNLSGAPDRLEAARGVEEAILTPQGIAFPGANLSISTRKASIWTPPDRPLQVLDPGSQRATLDQVIRLASSNKPPAGISSLLRAGAGGGSQETSDPLRVHLHILRSVLAKRLSSQVAKALEPFLGLGRGLTPSGDDLVMGVLLTLTRWGDMLAPELDGAALNRSIPTLAFQKTTALSASLIACAAGGLANERLLTALDGLMSGSPGVEECAALLSGWGSSSGFDALAGMAAVIGGS